MTGVREMERFEAAYRGLDAETQLRLDLVVAHRWGARWGWHEGVVNHLTPSCPAFPIASSLSLTASIGAK
jgi:hypothetical protein